MMDKIYICTDPAGDIKADKEKSTEKIDGAVMYLFSHGQGEFTASFGILQGGKEHCFYERGFCMK